MRFSNSNLQRGAVLAFSLVMLLLLTLAGTRMIQQNKQQLAMANNARLLTQEFSNAEAILAEAKNIIDLMPQHVDSTHTAINNQAHQCVPTSSYKQNIGLAKSVTGINGTTILAASCMSSVGVITQCTSYNAGVVTCHPKSGDVICTTKTLPEITGLFTGTTDVCYQDYDPSCTNPNGGSDPSITASLNPDDNYNPNPRCRLFPPNPLPPPNCPKEIYTIQVISTNANGTTRQIVSDHVVGCGT